MKCLLELQYENKSEHTYIKKYALKNVGDICFSAAMEYSNDTWIMNS